MHDSPSLQIEKEQDEDRAEEHVERLHEVTSPGNVVAEESCVSPLSGRASEPTARGTKGRMRIPARQIPVAAEDGQQ